MSEWTEQFKEPFENSLNHQLLFMEHALEDLEAHKEMVNQWPTRKKRIMEPVLDMFKKWVRFLEKIKFTPLVWKKYKKEKKRLVWIGRKARFSIRLRLFYWQGLNIIRILMILGFFIGGVVALVYIIAGRL